MLWIIFGVNHFNKICIKHDIRVKYVKIKIINFNKNDKRYQLDATIVSYYLKLSVHVLGTYMPVFRSIGCMLLHMVFSTKCCCCGPKEPVRSLVHCVCKLHQVASSCYLLSFSYMMHGRTYINFNLCISFLELILYKGEPLFKLAGEFHITGECWTQLTT